MNSPLMPLPFIQLLPEKVPEPDCAVVSYGGKALPIRAKANAIDHTLMSFKMIPFVNFVENRL
jgi:hypothetical protein